MKTQQSARPSLRGKRRLDHVPSSMNISNGKPSDLVGTFLEDSAEAFDPSAAADSTGGAKGERKRQSALSESDMDSSQSDDSSAYSGLSGSDDYDSEDDLEQQKRTREKSSQKLKEAVAAPDLTTAAETVELTSEPRGNKMVYQAAAPDLAEYDLDSSDEEDLRNTIGNVPMVWYENYPHIGYDWKGEKIMKPAKGDELDKFLKRMDDPDFWKTVKDKLTGQDVVLTDEELDIIQKIQAGKMTVAGDPYEPYDDIFSHEVMKTSLSSRPPHKRSFIPSLLEKEKISKLVHAIKMGWITAGKPKAETPEEEEETFYALWEKEEEDPLSKSERARKLNHVWAPKLHLPGHAESYNPPPEYLLTNDEKKKWRSEDPEDRKLNFVPRQYASMRVIPGWNRFIKERFERCLDLYLCPRQRKMKVNVDPEDLIPTIPRPRDLQPFPTVQSIVYKGHLGPIRCLSVHQDGQFLSSGADDCTIRVWEVATGRCFRTYKLDDKITSLAWCPKVDVCLLAAAAGKTIVFLNPEVGDKLVASNTDHLLENLGSPIAIESFASFQSVTSEEKVVGERLKLVHSKNVTHLSWHPKGDYLATVATDGPSSQVIMHQLSKLRSQMPFKKLTMVQKVLFHPSKPFLFICTQRSVRIYDLSKQLLKKTLQPSCQFISCAAIHPLGDNVLVGSFDHRLCWFDLDSSVKPYQTLRHHNKAIRQVAFHKKYPLFASCSDDGSVIVSHGMVYSDLNQFPLIVPVKVLRGHTIDADTGMGVLDVQFHPTQPWLFSTGADQTIRLFV